MSWVTDILLIFSLEELYCSEEYANEEPELKAAPVINNINVWLQENNYCPLDNLSDHVVSSGKAMQAFVYGGAFNHFKVNEFTDLIRTRHWYARRSVQLLVKREQEEFFTLYTL